MLIDHNNLHNFDTSAAVVRRILEIRRSGMAYGKIAAALNREEILSRAGIGKPTMERMAPANIPSCGPTVKQLLNDEVYLDTVTQNRTGARSYKDKTKICKPESKWISHEDADPGPFWTVS